MPPVSIGKSLVGPVRILHCLMSCRQGNIVKSANKIINASDYILYNEGAAKPGCLIINIIPEETCDETQNGSAEAIACYSHALTSIYYAFAKKSGTPSITSCDIFLDNCRKALLKEKESGRIVLPSVDSREAVHVTDIQHFKSLIGGVISNFLQISELYGIEDKTHNGDSVGPFAGETDNRLQVHDVVDHGVLGGTFDTIHYGHKLLLSEAALRCRKSLTIGVTDETMIRGKTLPELIRPLEQRIRDVESFLSLTSPSLETIVVPIQDPFGPSIVDPKFELIVVSEETLRGGLKVNEKRVENGLLPLKVHLIPVIEDRARVVGEEEKISSSSLRRRKLGHRLRPLKENTHIPSLPHVIGLTGGIASGKSSIAKRLARLGAGIVDCDALGHRAYIPGTSCFRKIVSTFGEDIVGVDGAIDRRKLGSIVFSDNQQLQKLNQIVWPEIAELAASEVRRLYTEGKQVVVLDAAVLLEAGWNDFCHEVWVSVIPQEEAVRRVVERNGLEPEAAKMRVSAQLTNLDRVRTADIVFSTLWEPEFTQKQVEEAWEEVKPVLEKKLKSSL